MQQISELCTELAVLGGDMALQVFHSRKFTSDVKADKSYATSADRNMVIAPESLHEQLLETLA